MKRPIVAIYLSLASVSSVLTGGCSPEASQTQERAAQSGWHLPPLIDVAEQDGAGLRVRGHAEPGARIVLRVPGGTAYAVSADDRGQFEVRVGIPSTDTLFVIEIQNGQVATPAPYRLLVPSDPEGPIALVGSGVASIRLDPTPGLDAIDSDGRAIIASGRTAASRRLEVQIDDRIHTVQSDARGRWSFVLDSQDGYPSNINVDGKSFAIPAMNLASGQKILYRNDIGWRLNWFASPQVEQFGWFPE